MAFCPIPRSAEKYDRHGDNWANWEQIEAAETRARRGGRFRWSTIGRRRSWVFTFGDRQRQPIRPAYSATSARTFAVPLPLNTPQAVSLEEAFQGTTRVLELPPGRRLEVKIPPGVDDGSRVRVAAEGGRRGTVYLVVSVQPHANFQRKGKDLYTEVEVPLEDAILGGETTVPTLRGKVTLTIPPETQNGRRFRLAGPRDAGLE